MRSTQTKFLEKLERLIHEHQPPLELVHDAEWANTGKVYVQRATSFDPLLTMSYSFQRDYATFCINGESVSVWFDEKVKRGDATTLDGIMSRIIDLVLIAAGDLTEK